MDRFTNFNVMSSQFLSDIEFIAPELKKEVRTAKLSMNMSVMADVRSLQRIFTEHVVIPYGNYIHEENDIFMTGVESRDKTTNYMINIVRIIWTTLDSENRSHVWNYLKNLIGNQDQRRNKRRNAEAITPYY